jgi:hypothetical protein
MKSDSICEQILKDPVHILRHNSVIQSRCAAIRVSLLEQEWATLYHLRANQKFAF